MTHANVAVFVPHAGCPQRCAFCNQNSISGETHFPTERDISAAMQTAIRHGAHAETTELAFFGGSFTCIDREKMCALLAHAQTFIKAGTIRGIRISTRPDAIDEETLVLLRRYGVTAIELGCQSLDDAVLEKNLRGHTAQDVENACRLIRAFGFSLGVQMMTGLPGDTDETAKETAKRLITLQPDTARVYPTVVLKGTLLADWYHAGTYRPQTLDEAVTLCSRLLLLFESAGVRVIRMGLHAEESVELEMLAGAYHPAFRELCQSRIYLDRALALLRPLPSGTYTLCVGAPYLSQAIGQKRSNLSALEHAGYRVRFCGKSTLMPYEVTLDSE